MLIDSYNPQEPLFNEAIFLVFPMCHGYIYITGKTNRKYRICKLFDILVPLLPKGKYFQF